MFMNKNDVSEFVHILIEHLEPYRKEQYVPTFVLINELNEDWAIDFDVEQDEVKDIVHELVEKGFILIELDEEDYLPLGSSDEEIKSKYIEILSREDIDIELMYYLGSDEFVKKHSEVFSTLCNCTFFAIKQVAAGIQVTLRTQALLFEALQEHHCEIYPEDADRIRGWIDEEVKSRIGEQLKGKYFPSFHTEKIMQDLMIKYGEYPLCYNILRKTLEEMQVSALPVLKNIPIPQTDDEKEVKQHLIDVLQNRNIDFDRCFKEGIDAIDPDTMQFAVNHYYFAFNPIKTLDKETGFQVGHLLSTIIQEIHEDNYPDEEVKDLDSDDQFELSLKIYAKNGYVPAWIVAEHFQRLKEYYGNISEPTRIRDEILDRLSLKVLVLEKYEYLPEGTSIEKVREYIANEVQKWNLKEIFESSKIPNDSKAEYGRLIATTYFAINKIDSIDEARELVLGIIAEICSKSHYEKNPDEIPQEILETIIEKIRESQDDGIVSASTREECKNLLLQIVDNDWYVGWIVDECMRQEGLSCENSLDLCSENDEEGYSEEDYNEESDIDNEEDDDDILELTDEDGITTSYMFVDIIWYNEVEYLVAKRIDDDELVFMEIEDDENGESSYYEVTSQQLIDELKKDYYNRKK